MREIKFRAWDRDNKKWLDTGYLAISPESGELLEAHDPGEFVIFDSTNYALMQFTGLKDKNGKEIYEGDWCRFMRRGESFETKQGLVEFFGSGFKAVIDDREDALNLDRYYEIETIGNIYENPELLGNHKN
jgi:uncharacterized phage protein (TIGR01671 family)